MDKAESFRRQDSFVKHMATRNTNVEGGPVYTWVSGGLNYHVEHHLFPSMPHWWLPYVSQDAQALLARHGIPYNSMPLPTVIFLNLRHLMNPYGPTAPSAISKGCVPATPSCDGIEHL